MTTPHKRITKKIENYYVVWFEERNYWIQFEEPAFFVYTLYSRGVEIIEISRKCTRRYGLPELESQQFVDEIIDSIRAYSSPAYNTVETFPDYKEIDGFSFSPYAIHCYQINTKKIEIAYETALAGYYLHPILEHL